MKTKELIKELERTLSALKLYESKRGESPGYMSDPNHSSAMRASMDLTRGLANWRKLWRSMKQ